MGSCHIVYCALWTYVISFFLCLFYVTYYIFRHNHRILHIRIGAQFQTSDFDFMNQTCPERVFPVDKRKMALLSGILVNVYSIKLFCTVAERDKGIFMSLLLLVVETKILLISGMPNKNTHMKSLKIRFTLFSLIKELSNSQAILSP